ncbi:MAG: NusG domain II-containing protein [Clostridia bacterium]
MKYVKKADIIYISSLICVCIASSIALYFGNKNSDITDKVVVEADGIIYGTYSLHENQKVEINDIGTNLLVIEDGKVYMESADCPDKICVAHHALTSNLGVIACLPNRVIVYLELESEYSDVDMVT